MRLRVLGCSGGELPAHRATCFLVDGVVAIDAGALASTLQLEEIARIDHVLLTHSHLDHVKDVPMIADLLVGRRERPVTVHASHACARVLRECVFNGLLWPDFTRLPDARDPVLVIEPFAPGERFRAGGYEVRSVLVNHSVESVALLVSDGGGTLAVSGDTGPTEALWEVLDATPDVRALLLETSFPDRLQALADVSGHLTPRTMAGELGKLRRRDFPVLLHHLKPAYEDELRREIDALRLPRVAIVASGDDLRL